MKASKKLFKAKKIDTVPVFMTSKLDQCIFLLARAALKLPLKLNLLESRHFIGMHFLLEMGVRFSHAGS